MAKLKGSSESGQRRGSDFEAAMRPHFDALYGRAYRLTGDASDAEDLVQELCIRVFPRIDELAGLDNPRAWLMRVLYRLFVDLARGKQRSPLRLVDTDGTNIDEYFQVASDEPGPEQCTEAMLRHERFQRAWRYLDAEQQGLLVLQGIEGHSLAEIEAITGLPQGTLKSRLHRARLRLGRLLEREVRLANYNAGDSDDELPRHRKSIG